MKKKLIILSLLIFPIDFFNNNIFASPIFNIETNIDNNNTSEPRFYQIALPIKHVLGPKVGISMAGFTNYGLQGYSFKPSYGIMGIFRIARNFGLHVEINYLRMGTRDTQLPIPIGVKDGNNTTKEEESSDVMGMVKGAWGEIKDRLIFKKEQNITIHYISIPISICLIFKSHQSSFITNYFLFGGQINILLDANVRRYASPSMLLHDKEDEEYVYENWGKATKCEGCVEERALKDKVNDFDFGISFGYMFETDMGFLFGFKYYEGLYKIFVYDENDWNRQRKNTALEFFISYNFASFF